MKMYTSLCSTYYYVMVFFLFVVVADYDFQAPLLTSYTPQKPGMENINIAYQSPEAAQYMSRLPLHRIQNMARVCQVLRNNGLEEAMAQNQNQQNQYNQDFSQTVQKAQWNHNALMGYSRSQGQLNHNVLSRYLNPAQQAQSNHNVLSQYPTQQAQWTHNVPQVNPTPFVPNRNNRTMSSGSSLESYPYVLSQNQPPPITPDKKKTKKETTSCIRRSLTFSRQSIMPDKENNKEDTEPKLVRNKFRSTFHGGLCGQGDVEGVVKPKVDNGKQTSFKKKEDLVMGKGKTVNFI